MYKSAALWCSDKLFCIHSRIFIRPSKQRIFLLKHIIKLDLMFLITPLHQFLLYGSELWGIFNVNNTKLKDTNNIQINIVIKIIKVRLYT